MRYFDKEDSDQKILDLLNSLTDKQKRCIADFDTRIGNLYHIEESVRETIKLSEKLRKAATEGKFKGQNKYLNDIQINAKRLLAIIDTVFTNVLDEKRIIPEEQTALEEELRNLKRLEYIEFYDTKQIEDTLKSGHLGEESETELESLQHSILEGQKQEQILVSITSHLESILVQLAHYLSNQKAMLQYLKLNIQFYIDLKKEELLQKAENIEQIEAGLRRFQDEFGNTLREEKELVIDPFNKFLKKKRMIYHTLMDLFLRKGWNAKSSWKGWNIFSGESQGKITKKDILEDMHTFSKLSETHAYVNELLRLPRKYIEKDALLYLYKINKYASHLTSKKEYELRKALQLTVKDLQTDAYNFRYLKYILHKFVQRALAGATPEHIPDPVSIIMIDIDFFKSINDHYGHQGGDNALRLLVKACQSQLKDDSVCRYGGDEFCVVLEKIDKERAVKITQRIRNAINKELSEYISEMEIKLGITEVAKVTISLGIATCPDDILSEFTDLAAADVDAVRDALIRCADKNLYTVKKNGRDGICYLDTKGKPIIIR